MIVGMTYIETAKFSGEIIPIPIVTSMESNTAINTLIPVPIIVNEFKSTDFNSFTLTIITPKTILWIFRVIHR